MSGRNRNGTLGNRKKWQPEKWAIEKWATDERRRNGHKTMIDNITYNITYSFNYDCQTAGVHRIKKYLGLAIQRLINIIIQHCDGKIRVG